MPCLEIERNYRMSPSNLSQGKTLLQAPWSGQGFQSRPGASEKQVRNNHSTDYYDLYPSCPANVFSEQLSHVIQGSLRI
ncbi:hypothetical protein scyTo_0004259 [Scyliorhinus torazame]|uniref:Uncharacterized protein n=1 Tax=Scyliorhinus torazame TaxID=75743 RepID=A0A401NNP6_SCYTO|nr:hypothetical protein [Scyliorhinus torazame]